MSKSLKIAFLEKKSFKLIYVHKIFKTVWGNFSKINRSQDILTFRDFAILKIVLHSKIINKMQTNKQTNKKNQ